MEKFDVLIIGAGPGGYTAAVRAARLGLKTAIVERSEVGGVCLNAGCIPTKAILKSARVYETAMDMESYGIDLMSSENEGGFRSVPFRPDLSRINERKDKAVDRMRKGVEFLFRKYGVTLFRGNGEIVSPGSVKISPLSSVSEEENSFFVEADNIIIATGASPNILPLVPVDGEKIITYWQAISPEKLPSKMAVIGSGAIGSELSYFYASMGVEVHLIEYLNRIVPLEDEEVSAQLSRCFKKCGITVSVGMNVKKAERYGEGIRLFTEDKKGEHVIDADIVLSAAGVRPNTFGLGLENLGVKMSRGKIDVDEKYATSVKGIYAIGDVIATPALAHVASMEGIRAVEGIAGIEYEPLDYLQVPACTFTTPEIASVGMTEEKVRMAGIDYRAGKFSFVASGKAVAAGETDGFVKMICEKETGKILGVHIIGSGASEMIGGMALAMRMGAKCSDIAATIFPHPTMSEGIREVAESLCYPDIKNK